MRFLLPPNPGPCGERGRAQLPLEDETVGLCSYLPPQGPFVHLSVMLAAYLGRVLTKTTGESEVSGSRRAPLGKMRGEGGGWP